MTLRLTPLLLILVSISCEAGHVPLGKPTQYPAWWFSRDVISPLAFSEDMPVWPHDYPQRDDYAAANIGQLKNFATAAAAELDNILPSPGAGLGIHALIASWLAAPEPNSIRDDFGGLNQGQLKAVAGLFYQRLAEVNQTPVFVPLGEIYPWSTSTLDDDSYALVNLGQLKNIFSFTVNPLVLDSYLQDSDGDGIPDGWEIENGLNPLDTTDAVSTSGGLTYLQIYQASLGIGADPLQANIVGLITYTP